jgi:hypothetical protein
LKSKASKKKRPLFNPKDWRDWLIYGLVILFLVIQNKVVDSPIVFGFFALAGGLTIGILYKIL